MEGNKRHPFEKAEDTIVSSKLFDELDQLAVEAIDKMDEYISIDIMKVQPYYDRLEEIRDERTNSEI